MVKLCSNPAYQLPVGKQVVAVDPAYFRPTEVELLIGDATKAGCDLAAYLALRMFPGIGLVV